MEEIKLKKIASLISILFVFSLVLSACAQPTPETVVEEVVKTVVVTEVVEVEGETVIETQIVEVVVTPEPEEEEPMAEEGFARGEILNRVLERGKVVCGGRTDLLGFGYLDESGNNVGFDIDTCRAVAAAVLGDPEAVEIVPLTAADRGPALQTAEVDILSRNATWTSSREAQWGNFTIVTFYDGQGFMVPVASGITTIEEMDGASVCVTSGTTTEQNLADAFRERGLSYEPVIFEETASVYGAYEEGRCDVTTSDISQLASVREGFADPDAHVILSFAISKEPLTPAVPHGDDQWFDIVKSVIYGLINAEELGVTQANVEEMKSSENINTRRLLGQEGEWGNSDLGVDVEALASAVAAVGNYGEMYDRYFGLEGDAFTLPRGLNELWTNGGLIYAPPIR
jgi:general L-amino acid transport system substrate-binding protein